MYVLILVDEFERSYRNCTARGICTLSMKLLLRHIHYKEM
jgi:hypothetical protein